jgi:hypothetical protein
MRVSQIQNLTWAGNVLLLAGLAWVGVQFWDARKQKAAKEWKWDTQKASTDGPRWPGDVAAFTHIWQTPINGKVPLPPVKQSEVVVKVDKVQEFKGKLKYYGGWDFIGQPESSIVRISFDGKDLSVSPGATIGGFQLVQFSLDDTKKTAKLVFINPDSGDPFTIEQQQSAAPPLTGPGNTPTKPGRESDLVKEGIVTENGPLPRNAWTDPASGEIKIPEEECVWLEHWGEKNVWANLETKPDVDAQGVSHGVKFTKIPEVPPLKPTHGIGAGDIVRSINGVPVTSKEDILNYLRGDGRGQKKYEVVIETNGKTRTVIYKVCRGR